MEIRPTEKFGKSYKKRIAKNPSLVQRFEDRLLFFEKEPFHPSLETHKLSGKLDDLWAFSVANDCRVLVDFQDDNQVALLLDIGTHDQVY